MSKEHDGYFDDQPEDDYEGYELDPDNDRTVYEVAYQQAMEIVKQRYAEEDKPFWTLFLLSNHLLNNIQVLEQFKEISDTYVRLCKERKLSFPIPRIMDPVMYPVEDYDSDNDTLAYHDSADIFEYFSDEHLTDEERKFLVPEYRFWLLEKQNEPHKLIGHTAEKLYHLISLRFDQLRLDSIPHSRNIDYYIAFQEMIGVLIDLFDNPTAFAGKVDLPENYEPKISIPRYNEELPSNHLQQRFFFILLRFLGNMGLPDEDIQRLEATIIELGYARNKQSDFRIPKKV